MGVAFHSPLRGYEADRDEIDPAVARVLGSGWYVLGPEVERFEERFASYVGVDHAVGVASGTDALVLALRAAGVVAGDEVITVANAGGYTAAACALVGAVAVFADVEPGTLTMDPESVSRMLSPRTKAIVATHLYGSLCAIEALAEIAARAGVMLIEDCAQAHGARRGGKAAGSFGDLATFSFYPTKNLGALGDGGAVVCRNEALAGTLRELRQYGWRGKYRVELRGGMNSRLDPVQAAVLSVRLDKIGERTERRREIADRYASAFEGTEISVVRALGEAFVGHLLVVRTPGRDAMRVALSVRDIGTDIHYPVLDCDQPAWRGLGWRADVLPVSRRAAAEILSLPLYPELRDEEVDEVCEAVLSSIGADPVGGAI